MALAIASVEIALAADKSSTRRSNVPSAKTPAPPDFRPPAPAVASSQQPVSQFRRATLAISLAELDRICLAAERGIAAMAR